MARDIEDRKPPMSLRVRFKICFHKDLYSFLAGIHFHSDRCIAKIYFMTTTVLASNNRMRHFPPLSAGTSETCPWRSGHLENSLFT
jgi:hypothetical protein